MSQWLISAAELNALKGQNIVIFDCRFSLTNPLEGKSLYLQGHIPGAHHLDMEMDLSGPKHQHGGRHPLPDTKAFEQTMQRYGVNQNSLIVVYDSNRLAGSARLWWLLQYFGHPRVKILNGGLPAWLDAGLPTTNVPEKSTSPGDFQAKENPSMIVDATWVKKHITNRQTIMVDSREAPRYLGREEPIDPVAGHIPGAVNAPWQQVTFDNGCVKPVEQQREIWSSLPMAEYPIVYCGSGVTACVNLLSLSLAGIETPRLYPGSWSDWCSYPDNPIEPPYQKPDIAL